jgi:hypothetical protein
VYLFQNRHVVDGDLGLLDVLPHELVVVGGEEGPAAALQQVLRHPVGDCATVCKTLTYEKLQEQRCPTFLTMGKYLRNKLRGQLFKTKKLSGQLFETKSLSR